MLKNKKILLVLPEFPPAIGGMQTHAKYLAEYLYKNGYLIEVVAYHTSSTKEKQTHIKHDRKLAYPIHRKLSRIGFQYNLRSILKIHREFQSDVIYCSTVFYGILKSKTTVPIICRCIGNDVLRPWIAYPFSFGSTILSSQFVERLVDKYIKKYDFPDFLERIFLRKRQAIIRQSSRLADKILANSYFTSKLLHKMKIPHQRIFVLSGGVDYKGFDGEIEYLEDIRSLHTIPKSAYVIITVCRLVPKKGVKFLIDTLSQQLVAKPSWYLLIVGEGRQRRKLQKHVKRLNLCSNIIFTGSIPNEEVVQYYKQADVFVLASKIVRNKRTNQFDVETMGRVLCEANAAGIPIIASRSGGISSIIKHKRNGLLFDSENPIQLLSHLKQLETDHDLKDRLVKEGLRMARENFSWEKILTVHHELFQSTLD